MDIVDKRLTDAVKEHEEYLGDFLGLDVRGADGWNLSIASDWFKGDLMRFGIVDPLASNVTSLFVRWAGAVLADAPRLREKFAAISNKSDSKAEVSNHENRD